MDRTLESKIRGCIYGYAIGDAMGATTEFLFPQEIKHRHGKVKDIVGGGWLRLEAGEATDDTQMTMSVAKAFIDIINSGLHKKSQFIEIVCKYFIDWYYSKPKDIGNSCRKGIERLINKGYHREQNTWNDQAALGNGSLMRAMPLALFGREFIEWNMAQGALTHSNRTCAKAIVDYSSRLYALLNGLEPGIRYSDMKRIRSHTMHLKKLEPVGHVRNTYVNSIYWSSKETFEEAIIGAVNDGGDADTIAAITGSLAGARRGFEAIPARWVGQLKESVRNELDAFIEFCLEHYDDDFSYIR